MLKVTKSLAAVEDLLPGVGKELQYRNNREITVTKVNASFLNGVCTVNTDAEFRAIDIADLGDIKVVSVVETGRTYKWDQPNNTWLESSSGGQFADIGTDIGKGIMYTANVSGIEDIVVKSGTNAFSSNNVTLSNGASLTLETDATYKII